MEDDSDLAWQLELQGPVQGRGLRPRIVRHAKGLGIRGWVENTVAGVTVVALGGHAPLSQFVDLLKSDFAPVVQIRSMSVPSSRIGSPVGFEIRTSVETGPLSTTVPPDLATCRECFADTQQQPHRRDYLLTTCVSCGPRYSVIESMPFDRERTTLGVFPLCESCASEYGNPSDRRCHAQTIGCAHCGPNWWISVPGKGNLPEGHAALAEVIAALRDGKIVALRGLGGYQLLCDATHDAAVRRLREKKRRPTKPLAILATAGAMADRLAHWEDLERTAFQSAVNPIVLVAARSGQGLSEAIHPNVREIGVMAPTTPLHARIIEQFGAPLVVTSGNRDGEPLVVDVEEAESQLKEVADLFVHHNRPIRNPVDDSVVRVMAGKLVTLRLARGLAPLVLPKGPWDQTPRIALGGQQKVAPAIANGVQAVLGPHVGDLDGAQVQARFRSQIVSAQHLYRIASAEWVHDSHPGFESTRIAHEMPGKSHAIHHHHAHILAGMLEAGWTNREVLGVAFDGTGWGPGGQIWGGEFLLVSGRDWRRVGHLHPIPLPGGERAIREPWRIALALLAESLPHDRIPELADRLFPGSWKPLWRLIQQTPIGTNDSWIPQASSVGRLFDGVAALVTGIQQMSYEGEAALYLESLSESTFEQDLSALIPLSQTDDVAQLDWRPMVRHIVRELESGARPGVIAHEFHLALSDAVARMTRLWPTHPVVLSGGCFQNRLLVETIADRLEQTGQALFTPGVIPPNDGGLAAGQLVGVAMQ